MAGHDGAGSPAQTVCLFCATELPPSQDGLGEVHNLSHPPSLISIRGAPLATCYNDACLQEL